MMEHDEQLVDELLVMECQDGSVKAFDSLVRRWQKRLWRYAYRLTGDSEAAWDVTQESWLAVVRGINRLQDPARFKSWVYRIVTHKTQDWIAGKVKARRRYVPAVSDEPEQSGLPERELSDELQDLMRRLPPSSRIILTLHYLEGWPVAEMAGILGIPEGTVKSRLHGARNELKTLWLLASEERSSK
ncbi:MAG: hypothetical protein A2Y76_09760 [Planctomycetes bacterium RBG_13_60_9]|nr:MAG: hypothetical protein A2Y76_09760 [Planctomycetes bacterium RBG_13_60_9]